MNPKDTPRAAEPLARALRRAAAQLDAQALPATLRGALLERLIPGAGSAGSLALPACAPASVPPARPARAGRWLRLSAWSGGAAVCATLALGSALLLGRPEPLPTARAAGGEFMPIVPRVAWPEDTSPAWLVASELPLERLGALGLPYDPTRAAERVRAELLVHPSGLVLALRLVD